MMNESANNLSKEQQFYIKKTRHHKHLVLFFQIFIFVFFIILQFWPLRRVIEREREPISALRAAAFAAVALRNASLRLGVTVPFHTFLPSEAFG